jgi:hypothetical protein
MLSALKFWLSPSRRRFMRQYGNPALAAFKQRLTRAGSQRAFKFITHLLRANVDFLAYALNTEGGPLEQFGARASIDGVERCVGALLVYSVNLFARDELADNDSELIPLLAAVVGTDDPKRVMLMRDALRKAPRSEEWMLITWLADALGASAPRYDGELERSFGYQYLSYIGQYRSLLERELSAPDDAGPGTGGRQ